MDTRTSNSKNSQSVVETTVGDLIAAISEIALKAGRTEQEGYRLASLTLEKIMRERMATSQIDA